MAMLVITRREINIEPEESPLFSGNSPSNSQLVAGSIFIYWGKTWNQATQLETLRCETSYQGKFEEFTLNGKKVVVGIVTLIYIPSFH